MKLAKIDLTSMKHLLRWSDILVVAVFLSVIAFLFMQSRPQLSWMEAQMHPDQAKEIMMQEISGTPLHPEYNPRVFSQRFKTWRINLTGWFSEKPFSNRFVHYFNSMQGWVADCSSCSDEDVCADLEEVILPYPIDITQDQLKEKMNGSKDLMIIDVRDVETYTQAHIPDAVNLPLLEMVDWVFPTNRWSEIVIVGDSYFQTKIAVETLRRLNFHRLFRLISPVKSWDGELNSFL